MSTEVKDIIPRGEISVLIIPNETYMKKMLEVTTGVSKEYKSVCYISLNKIVAALKRNLENRGADLKKFSFVDAVTKSADPNFRDTEDCIGVSSAAFLTELSIAIDKMTKAKNCDVVIFDSLSTLVIYSNPNSVVKFIQTISNRLQARGITGIFAALEGDTQSGLLKEIGMFVDNVEHVGGEVVEGPQAG